MRSRSLLAALMIAGMAHWNSLPSPADETPSQDKINKLIEQMGSDTFTEREMATQALAVIGVPALEALHKAAKSGDAEVRKRAEEIIPQIEIQAENNRILAPKPVHLVYKHAPLNEAVADFQKQSGYRIHVHDPQGRLRERKITIDTGETTFWHALALFCDKAELTESSMENLNLVPQAPGFAPGKPAPGAPAWAGRPGAWPAVPPQGPIGMNGQLILKDGKSKQLPTDDGTAVRIRSLNKAHLFGQVPKGELIVPLEVSAEPRLQWQALQSIRIEKAVDDQDQKLTQVIPQVEGGVVFNGNVAIVPPRGGMAMQRVLFWDALHQGMPVQLKKGAKDAKSLKELKGVVTVQLLTEARALITADKLDKATGQIFKGESGGSIKIVEVNAQDRQTTIQVEFEQPPFDRVVPAQQDAMPGFGVRPAVRFPRAGGKMMPAPAAPPGRLGPPPANPALPQPAPAALPGAQIQIGGGGGIAVGAPMRFAGLFNGLSVQDDKGNALPIQVQQTQFRVVARARGARMPTLMYTFVCQHDKDKGQPAKVVYLGRKRVTVEIPFTVQDVPLP
jgi:hypothetical protein